MNTLLTIDKVYTSEDVYDYADNGNIDSLRLALTHSTHNPTVWYRDEVGRRAIHYATYGGYIECIRELLNFGANIESRDMVGYTPLMLSIERGHIKCMHVLLDRGANIESKDSDGSTSLMLAAEIDNIECMCELLGRGADSR